MFYLAPKVSQMGSVNARRPSEFPRVHEEPIGLRLVRIKTEMDFVIGKSSESGLARPDKTQAREEQSDQA